MEIVDKELINYTGGIIQGMSGAPIIQNDKLIGSITYVLKEKSKKRIWNFYRRDDKIGKIK